MEDDRRQILDKVRLGELSPQEAALELQDLEASVIRPVTTVAPAAPGGLARVRVVHEMGSVTVLGDASVAEAVADGPHTARRDGDALIIESEVTSRGFTFGGGRVRIGIDERRLVIRMNPALALDVDIHAGSLKVDGIPGPISGEVQAGSVVLDGFCAPLNLSVHAGSLKATGVLANGLSRVRCTAGSVKIHLSAGSDVRIVARTSMGKISLPDATLVGGIGAIRREAVIGAGKATLEIEAELGSVAVTADA